MSTSGDKAIAARVMWESKRFTLEQIAEILGVGTTTVHRWKEAAPATPQAAGGSQSAVGDLDALLDTQDLDAHGRFRAGVARRLAMRLDQVAISDKAQDALAMPQIAKELRAVVAEIMDVSEDDKAWLAGLLAPVGDAEESGA